MSEPRTDAANANAPAPAAALSFAGLGAPNQAGDVVPPDTSGDAGPTYYIQTVNSGPQGTWFGVFRKSDQVLVSTVGLNTLFSAGRTGTTCDNDNSGDPQTVYDPATDRWIIMDFTGSAAPYNFCMAVSKSGDPVTGGWYFYVWQTDSTLFPDYPKAAIWPDGLYVTANMFSSNSFSVSRAYVFNTAEMEAGQSSAHGYYFSLPTQTNGFGVFSALASTYTLATGVPPSGRENFVTVGYDTTSLRVWKFHINWTTPSSSTFTGPTYVSTSSFAVPPLTVPTTGANISTISMGVMTPEHYVNIGGSESLWLSQTVANPNQGSLGAVRWYQVTVSGGSIISPASQFATFAPDSSVSRIQPSIRVDRAGDALVGYTASSSSLNPSIRYAGRLAGDTANALPQTETSLIEGPGTFIGNCSGSTCNRWGDYSTMSLDPDGCTYWYTSEYYASSSTWNWNTRIGSTRYSACAPLTFGISSSVNSIAFGNTNVGSTASASPILISNTGTGTLVLNTLTISGTNATEFTKTSDQCSGVAIPAGSTCAVSISFAPSSSGSRSAVLNIPNNVPGAAPSTITLAGTGVTGPCVGPVNNCFANSTVISGSPSSRAINTSGATTETNEPAPCGLIASTVWYSWTADSAGTATVSTVNSSTNFDTVLAAYTGTALAGLANLACNDDASGSGLQSQISFTCAAGTTYLIQLGGFSGRNGTASLWVAGCGLAVAGTLSVDNVSLSPGANTTVPVRLTGISNFGSAAIRLAFDPSLVRVASVSSGNMTGVSVQSRIDNANGTLNLTGFTSDSSGPTGDFVFANVLFTPVGAAGTQATVQPSVTSLAHADGTRFTVGTQAGVLTIGRLGDVNGDGAVDIVDAMFIAQYSVGNRASTPLLLQVGDVNHDGSVDIVDAMFIAQFSVGNRSGL